MLRWLSIQGLALVDSVELEFAPGLNVLTGETGAGKSLVLGSIGLLLGDRADSAWLRSGESRGSVEGTFDLGGRPDLSEALRAHDAEPEEGRVVLRREVAANGTTRAFVNGRGVLLAQLRAVGDLLVDLHGQHEHQSLLRGEGGLETLDRLARLEEERDRFREALAASREAEQELERLEGSLRTYAERRDWLMEAAREIEEAKLVPGEEETLAVESARLTHADRLRGLIARALAAVSEEIGRASCRERV